MRILSVDQSLNEFRPIIKTIFQLQVLYFISINYFYRLIYNMLEENILFIKTINKKKRKLLKHNKKEKYCF